MPILPVTVVVLSLIFWSVCGDLVQAQASSGPDSLAMIDTLALSPTKAAPAWYDTLVVTRPQYAVTTDADRLYLGLFTVATLPLQLAFTVATIAPPSLVLLHEDEVARGAISVSTGVGIGRRSEEELFWPEGRIQIEWTRFVRRDVLYNWKVTLVRDWPMVSISSHDHFWLGASLGAGATDDGGRLQPYAHGMISVMNPMGMTYLMLFPMHTWGLRGRIGWDPERKRAWYELGIGGEATFWF